MIYGGGGAGTGQWKDNKQSARQRMTKDNGDGIGQAEAEQNTAIFHNFPFSLFITNRKNTNLYDPVNFRRT